MRMAVLAVLIALAACGKQGELIPKPPPGQPAKVDPTKPLPSVLLKIPTQAEPGRVDDPLQKSQERRDDRFNLPPQG